MNGLGKLFGKVLLRRRAVHENRSLLFFSRYFASSISYLQSPPPFAATSISQPPLSPFNTALWRPFGGQKRSMFIQTQSTPNPSSLMFYPGKAVMEVGSADFPNARAALVSPLAKSLYGIDGISRVFFGSDFVTVTKSEEASWDLLKPEIFAAIMDFYSSGKPLFLDLTVAASMDTAIHEVVEIEIDGQGCWFYNKSLIRPFSDYCSEDIENPILFCSSLESGRGRRM